MDELPSSAGSLDFSPWTIRAMTHQTSRFPPFAPYHTLPSDGELRHSPRSFTRKGLSPCFTLGKPWFLELFHVGTSTAWDGYGWWFRNPVPLEMYKTLVNKGGFFISTGAGFLPSTVWPPENKNSNNHIFSWKLSTVHLGKPHHSHPSTPLPPPHKKKSFKNPRCLTHKYHFLFGDFPSQGVVRPFKKTPDFGKEPRSTQDILHPGKKNRPKKLAWSHSEAFSRLILVCQVDGKNQTNRSGESSTFQGCNANIRFQGR